MVGRGSECLEFQVAAFRIPDTSKDNSQGPSCSLFFFLGAEVCLMLKKSCVNSRADLGTQPAHPQRRSGHVALFMVLLP